MGRPRLVRQGQRGTCQTAHVSDADDHPPTAEEGGGAPFWSAWTRNQRIGFAAFLVFLFAVLAPVASMATYDASKLVERGDAVEPGWGRDVVYVDDEDPQIRCTATTSNGESLTLAPFTGTHRRKSLGSRRGATRYWAVAVLPTDRGPLRISCPAHDTMLWIAAPDDNTWLYLSLGLLGALTVTLSVVALVLRRRRPPPAV